MQPRFSIVIPARDAGRWLPGAIESVRKQRGDWELVIGDNASSDSTGAIAEAAARDEPRIRYQRWQDVADVIASFNRTAALSRGRWVIPLGSDDRLEPDAIDVFEAAVEGSHGLAMVVAECARMTPDGRPAAHTWRFYQGVTAIRPGDYDAPAWIEVMTRDGQPPWNIGSIAFGSEAIAAAGGLFNAEAGAGSDTELVMRMAGAGTVRYVQRRVLVCTQRTDSDQHGQQRANRLDDSAETVLGRGLRIGMAAHERLRGSVSDAERRQVRRAIARLYVQRAAHHRLLPGGQGRPGAWRDVRSAWSIQPSAVLTPRQLLHASGALLAPRWLLASANRLLRLERA